MASIDKDTALIEQIGRGDASAYAAIVERYKDRAFTLAMRLLHSREDAEEVLQDAFVRAFRSLAAFDGHSAFATWFYRILYNVCMTRLTKRKRSPTNVPLDEIEFEPSQDQTPFDEADSFERKTLVHQAIEQLPEQYATVVTLFYVQEMSHEEIAEVTGMPIGTIKTNLHRARKQLAEILRKRGVISEKA